MSIILCGPDASLACRSRQHRSVLSQTIVEADSCLNAFKTDGARRRSPDCGDYLPCPFFSSCERTEAASFLASAVVGFLLPLRTLLASVDVLDEDCFFAILLTLRIDKRLDRPPALLQTFSKAVMEKN